MSVANLSLQNLWANSLATQSALSAPGSGIGASQQGSAPFANLVESLNSQSAVTNVASAAPSGTSNAQISTDLEAFMQSLQQALASAQNSGNPSASTATGAGNTSGASTDPSSVHHGHHGHGHGNINSLIQELSSSSSSANGAVGTSGSSNSSSSASSALTNLNSAFNQLMTDLGATANARTSGQLVNTAA